MKEKGNIYIYIVFVLLVAGIGVTAVLAYNSAITRAATAEKERDDFKQALDETSNALTRQVAENLRLDQLLLRQRKGDQQLRNLERKVDELTKAALQDPDIRKWYDTPVPAQLLSGLHNARTGEPERGNSEGSRKLPSNPGAKGVATSTD